MVAQSLSLALSVVLVALVAQRVEAAPSAAAAIPTHVPTGNPKDQCGSIEEFHHQYCCHYDGVLLPNPRQVDLDTTNKEGYYYNAAGEFSDFIPLINANCHPKILTLLCFFYFPICMKTQNELLSIFPCKSVCEEVTAPDSNCTKLLNRAGLPWGDHFNCSGYTYKDELLYKEDKSQCVNNALPRKTCPTGFPTPSTEEQPTTTAAEPTSAATTQAPTPDPEEACLADQQESCKKCRFRNALNGNTFVNNLDYNYAAKARFEGYTTHGCRRALSFTLEQSYPLKSSDTCLVTPPIPQSFLTLGEHVYCEKEEKREENGCFKSHLTQKKGDPLEVGESYLVAGTYDSASGNWEALDRPLIALWDKKVAGRIENALTKGNDARC